MTSGNPTSLLRQRKFLPYFVTQFLGALNDNVFKNSLLLIVAFASADSLPISSNLFINLAAGLFILPFFLFSASAGVLADKYEKSWFIRKVKQLEIAIMFCAAFGFLTNSYLILLLLLFLMGTQSAFFGPVKYSLLPQQLNVDELLRGNAFVEAGTFIAILLGTLLAGVITSFDNASTIAAVTVVALSICGYLTSRSIPLAPSNNPDLNFRWQPIKQAKQTLKIIRADNVIFQCILAISWFWFLGAVYLTQFPNFTKLHLNGTESAVAFLLALFSVGIALGSILCNQLSKGRIDIGIVPLGAIGIAIFGYLMPNAIPDSLPTFTRFVDFITYSSLWMLFSYLLLIGICGGLFIVPLYALMQHRAKADERSQVIAGLNILNSLFMVGSAILGMVALGALEFSIPDLFILLAVMSAFVAVYLLRQVAILVVRFLIWLLTHTIYRVKHKNLHHLPETGGALIVCNHVSYMDALLLSAACPRLIRFVMEEDYTQIPLIKPFLKKIGVIPISANNHSSIRQAFSAVEKALSEGHLVCIFPEGKLTPDGEIGEFMRGMDVIIRRSPVPVIPMALKGVWGSYFSRKKGRACKGLPNRFWSRLEVEVGEAVMNSEATSAELREKVKTLRGDWQ